MEDDHDVVVLQVGDRREPGLGAVKGILIVQDHRPAAQRFEFGCRVVAIENLVETEARIVRVVLRQVNRRLRGVSQRVADGRLDRRQIAGVVPLVTKQVEQHREDLVL